MHNACSFELKLTNYCVLCDGDFYNMIYRKNAVAKINCYQKKLRADTCLPNQ